MSKWIALSLMQPKLGQQVVLANVRRYKAFESFGCAKDVGVLCDGGNQLYWSTQGESRARTLDAYTHWLPITEPET